MQVEIDVYSRVKLNFTEAEKTTLYNYWKITRELERQDVKIGMNLYVESIKFVRVVRNLGLKPSVDLVKATWNEFDAATEPTVPWTWRPVPKTFCRLSR